MKFTTASIVAATAAIVSASPCAPAPSTNNTPAPGANTTQINDGDVFTVISIRPGTLIQNGLWQANGGAVVINTAAQNASCGTDVNYASFQLNNGTLNLYTEDEPQQMYVDRSGMGQGIMRYTTGDQPFSRNGERGPFSISELGYLEFAGEPFQACPLSNGGFYVWLSGQTNPGGNSNCIPMAARVDKVENPVKCQYTGF